MSREKKKMKRTMFKIDNGIRFRYTMIEENFYFSFIKEELYKFI